MPRLNRRDLIRFASWVRRPSPSRHCGPERRTRGRAASGRAGGSAAPGRHPGEGPGAISAAKSSYGPFERKQDIWLYEFKVVEPAVASSKSTWMRQGRAQAGGRLRARARGRGRPRASPAACHPFCRSGGYAVDGVRNGEEAWFRGDTEDYDAVILDLGLPRMDGLTVLKKWRGRPRRPGADPHRPGGRAERVAGIDTGAMTISPSRSSWRSC